MRLPIRLLPLCVLLTLIAPSVPQHYCTRTYTCLRKESYQSKCGFFNWSRCTRYKQVYHQCSRRNCCTGWTGTKCNQALCYGSVTCPNGGNCVLPGVCSCARGFSPPRCIDVNECTKGTSGCSQRCYNTIGSFICSCYAGYSLLYDRKSCADVNECLTNNGGCQQKCINQIGSYRCACNPGFTLHSNGKSCVDVDECKSDVMINGGCQHTCINQAGSYRCACDPGYALGSDGLTCVDINECQVDNGGCQHKCINEVPSRRCDCNPGFTLHSNGKTCIDVDECSMNLCSGDCENTVGSFSCSCPKGFQLNVDRVTCDDINECSDNNGGCADVCNNMPGSFQCECGKGFKFGTDGVSCEDINECNSFNGGCQEICTNSIGSFQCSCINGTLKSNGIGCEGTRDTDVFQRKGIARKLLPRGCAVVTLTRCTEGADVEVRLSSTAEWYKLNSNPSVIFTLGIVFVEVNDIALPMSITGMEIHNPNGNFMMKMGSLTYDDSGGTVLATDRNSDCFKFNLTPRDVYDFVTSGSFLSTFLQNIYKALPNWIKFTSTGFDILSINELKTDLLHGRDVQKVQACRGAPLFDNKLYTIFQFGSGFSLSVYGNEISLPKPLNGTEFCLIVDICRAYGGTIFLMFPPGSRELLSKLKVISDVQKKGGFKLHLNGIGLSIVKEINVHHAASKLTFWDGDVIQKYQIFPKANIWIGGSLIMNISLFDISAKTDIYVGFPKSPLSLLTHVFMAEWNALVKLNALASCTFKFKLFGKQQRISIQELGVSSIETHMSVGGLEPRQWCGANANPPGIFLSLRLSLNPFRNIPILGNWVFDNRHSVYAFVTYDQSDKIKNLPTVDLIRDIIDIQQIVNHFMEVFNDNLQRFKDLLFNTVSELLNLVNTALADLKAAIQQIVDDLQNFAFPDFPVVLDTIRNAWNALKMAAQKFFDAVEFNVEIAKHNFTEMIKFEVNRIKENVDAATEKAISEIISVTDDYTGFGVRYMTTIKVVGLEIFGLHLEFVYSVSKLGQCSRFQKVYQLLDGEKAAHALGIVSTGQKLGYFLKLKKGAGIGAAFGIDSNTFILQLHAEAGLLGITAEVDVFISKYGLTTYFEGKVWDLFRARLTMSAELGKGWYQLRYIVEGTLLPGGSDSFDGSFLDAFKNLASNLANGANKRITEAQQGLTCFQRKLTNAQNWLEGKKFAVRRAGGAFDRAVAALERVKQKLEDAKGPFRRALEKLKAAQKKVDNLCRIRNCRKLCIPGLKCKWCHARFWGLKIPYPCCKLTSCMLKIPDPICIAANLVCRGIRFIAYGALELAKLAVKIPMVALDVAKAAVSVAQIVVDKSRVVLDIAVGALEVAKIALEGVKASLEVAKAALEAVKFAVRAAFKVFELIITYGLQSIIDIKQCGFRVELSTGDLPIFDVGCEVNAFRLGWKTIKIRINFKNIVQSIWEAAKATISALLNSLKRFLSGRKRREIDFEANAKMHTLYRVIRQTETIGADEQLFNETLDVVDSIIGFKNKSTEELNDLSDRDNRIEVFAEKCATFNESEDYLRRVFDSLLGAASESKASLDNVTAVLENIPSNDSLQMPNNSLAAFGVNVSVGATDYNLTAEEMETAFLDTMDNLTEDPELKEALGASTFAKDVTMQEAKETAKMALVEMWMNVIENMTSAEYQPEVCANFRDCLLYNIQRLYELYNTKIQIPGANKVKGHLPVCENLILGLLNSVDIITVNDAYRYSSEIVACLDKIKAHDVFCKTAPQIIAGPRNTTVTTGESVQFTCLATGDPTPDYSWFKDGEELGITSKTLRLESVTDSDAGAYSCRAENYIAGDDSPYVYLTVIMKEANNGISLHFPPSPDSSAGSMSLSSNVGAIFTANPYKDQTPSTYSPLLKTPQRTDVQSAKPSAKTPSKQGAHPWSSFQLRRGFSGGSQMTKASINFAAVVSMLYVVLYLIDS